METYIPSGEKVLVKKLNSAEVKSAHGIIIATESDTVNRGTLVAVNPLNTEGNNLYVNQDDIGKTVIYPKFAGIAIGDDLFVIKQDEVLLIVEEQK